MSAQGRVTGQLIRSYCQVEQETIPCRLVDGDLQWLSYSFFGFFIVWGIGSLVFNEAHKAFKNGKAKRLLSFTFFWKWFRKKENLTRVSAMASIPTIAFISTPSAIPLVWIVSVFVIYLYKNWKEGDKQ